MARLTLATERLCLRPFVLSDAPDVQRLAGDREIAEMTLRVPHPYPDGIAEKWIESQPENFAKEKSASFAVVLLEDHQLIGAAGLEIRREHDRAELGYWIGKPYWGRGYGTEAAAAVLDFGFNDLNLNRIQAHHFSKNPASGRVMQKIGMTREGALRQAVKKRDQHLDVELYCLLKSEYTSINGV